MRPLACRAEKGTISPIGAEREETMVENSGLPHISEEEDTGAEEPLLRTPEEKEIEDFLDASHQADLQEQEERREDEPDWDGSEAVLVADEDAADYEDELTGIKITYHLTEEDLYACLKSSGVFRTTGGRAVGETVLLAVFGVIFLLSYFLAEVHNPSNLWFAGLCAAVIAAVWLVPFFSLRSRARQQANARPIQAEFFPDEIHVGKGEGAWTIPLDGSCYFERLEGLLTILTPEGRMAAFPLRSIEPAVLPEVEAILMAGTQPKPRRLPRRRRR